MCPKCETNQVSWRMLRVSPLGQGYFTCFLLMSFSFLYYVTAMGMLHQEAWSHQTGARKASNGSKPNSPRLPLNFEQRNNQIPKIWAIFLWMMSGKMAGEPKNQMALNPPTPATPAICPTPLVQRVHHHQQRHRTSVPGRWCGQAVPGSWLRMNWSTNPELGKRLRSVKHKMLQIARNLGKM